jgi:hypothetical protein
MTFPLGLHDISINNLHIGLHVNDVNVLHLGLHVNDVNDLHIELYNIERPSHWITCQ